MRQTSTMNTTTATRLGVGRKLTLLLASFSIFNAIYSIAAGTVVSLVPSRLSESSLQNDQDSRSTFTNQDRITNDHSDLIKALTRLPLTSRSLIQEAHRCAINLYGLPRMFQSLVLPSLVRNVITTNAHYDCDYYIHYYNVTYEVGGRNGKGGSIHPEHVYDIRAHILNASNATRRPPLVVFVGHTDDEFWKQRNETIQKIRHTKDPNGRYLYFPWKEKNYRYPDTTDNIVKMWHSIQTVWNTMKEHEQLLNIQYDRVAMLRSDVVYMTPIDIYRRPDGEMDVENRVAVIPSFAKYPVNDRLIYGPADAVEVWAAGRFDRMDDHVNRTFYTHEGYGLHSEQFVARALLPAIREKNISIEEHPTLCMFRARPGGLVRYRDCDKSPGNRVVQALGKDLKGALEAVVGRPCDAGARSAIRC